MNIHYIYITLALIILASYSSVQSFAAQNESVHDDHDHVKHGHEAQEEHEGHDDHDDHDHSTFEEASLPELMHLIEQVVEKIEKLSKSKSTGNLVELLEVLVAATEHLPEKSIMLEEAQLLRVKSTVGVIEKVALRLEAGAKEENHASVAKYGGQIHKLAEIIKRQYPASISEKDHRDGDHGHKDYDH